MFQLEDIEERYHIKLPEKYKRLYHSDLKELNHFTQLKIHTENDVICIRRFLKAKEIMDIHEEFFDFFGYDMFPIAKTEFDDYICLYYNKNVSRPCIV